MKYLNILLLSILLQGCGSIPTAIVSIPNKIVNLDSKVYESCKELLSLPPESSFENLLKVTLDNYVLYNECAKKQDLSIKLLKEFSNYKEVK